MLAGRRLSPGSSKQETGPDPGSFHCKPYCPRDMQTNSHLDTRELSMRILRKLSVKVKKVLWLTICHCSQLQKKKRE
jgi:hypothetical protein